MQQYNMLLPSLLNLALLFCPLIYGNSQNGLWSDSVFFVVLYYGIKIYCNFKIDLFVVLVSALQISVIVPVTFVRQEFQFGEVDPDVVSIQSILVWFNIMSFIQGPSLLLLKNNKNP